MASESKQSTTGSPEVFKQSRKIWLLERVWKWVTLRLVASQIVLSTITFNILRIDNM